MASQVVIAGSAIAGFKLAVGFLKKGRPKKET